jgi:hypothetical protein
VKEGAHLPLEAQYDQKAIEKWLEENDKITNGKLCFAS